MSFDFFDYFLQALISLLLKRAFTIYPDNPVFERISKPLIPFTYLVEMLESFFIQGIRVISLVYTLRAYVDRCIYPECDIRSVAAFGRFASNLNEIHWHALDHALIHERGIGESIAENDALLVPLG